VKKILLEQISQKKIQIYFENNFDVLEEMFERVNLIEYSIKLSLNAKHFCLFQQDEVVGFMAAYFNDVENKIAYISTVSIFPQFQGQGVGGEMLDKACCYANKLGFKVVRLQVRKNNDGALRFYINHGFSKVKTLEESYIYEKKIS